MERLTYDFCVGDTHCWQIKGADNLECREVCQRQEDKGCEDCPIAKAFDRLAAYEDTGLEPEEIISAVDMGKVACALHEINAYKELGSIDRLRELAKADREGKIPKYTIGDTVYDLFDRAWEVTSVERRLLAGEPKWIYRCGHVGTNDYCALWEFEVLTRAEAQAALRREQDG
jgi:hypothetical protein